MFDINNLTAAKAKPLPIVLLLDVSGSMNEIVNPDDSGVTGEGGEDGRSKIEILNDAVRRMVDSFVAEERMEIEFLVSIITFGDSATQHITPSAASSVNWKDMEADGCTAMGAAFSLVKKLLEDKDVIPSRAYRPAVVIVSDGQPTDDWEHSLEALTHEGRSSKCFFMSMGIGENPGAKVLERFISQTPLLAEVNGTPICNTVFHATDAEKINEFFSRVTMSMTTRCKSHPPSTGLKSVKPSIVDDGRFW